MICASMISMRCAGTWASSSRTSSATISRAADNIAVGRIEARDDRDAHRARRAKRSQADEVIAKLPAAYEQMIGKRFRNGVELSGGEWQKIAIARAYMREAARADPRRADGSARRAFRIRGVPALQGTERRQDGDSDLAPFFERPNGRPNSRARRRQSGSRGNASKS